MQQFSIAVDIGNSRIAFACFANGKMIRKWHHPLAGIERAACEIKKSQNGDKPEALFISSVVPSATNILSDTVASAGIKTINLKVDEQSIIKGTYPTMGTDRLANAIGGHLLYGEKGKTIAIIDFGSATTLTAVDSYGELLGGLITLGLKTTLTSLNASLEQLPILSLTKKIEAQNLTVFGKNTKDAILNGTIMAHLAMIDSWLTRCTELSAEPVNFVVTGGLAQTIYGVLPQITSKKHNILMDQDLTLKGINLYAQAAEDLEGRA
ncbi:MAG: type III pantothenate kinase [Candidatus Obscuribacterales bacterium]|nr:type III pantothenate kinase [Candidatus Obscuribacterales bacterium]